MATATQATRETVRAYHEAWTGPDVGSAGEYIADDFTTRAPVGSYDTKDDYLAGLANFRNQFVTGVDLISEFYGDNEAILLYDVHTSPSGDHSDCRAFQADRGQDLIHQPGVRRHRVASHDGHAGQDGGWRGTRDRPLRRPLGCP